jgi:hypothetical protein
MKSIEKYFPLSNIFCDQDDEDARACRKNIQSRKKADPADH